MLTHVDLFSGIGGFALAARWAGVETIAFAEIDPYASRVIERHFPGVRNYGDVRNVPAIDGVWLVTGGVPCQPASVAGKRLGAADDRWLWPEALAAVERIRPAWVLFENPTGILSLNDGLEFERICLALEGQGYEVQPIVIPACAVNAPHRRDRGWIVAHAGSADAGSADAGSGAREFKGSKPSDWQSPLVLPDASNRSGATETGNHYGTVSDAAIRENDQRERGSLDQAATGREGFHATAGSGRAAMAHTKREQRNRGRDGVSWWRREPQETLRHAGRGRWEEDGVSIPESELGRVADGLPGRVDRLRCLGNAIVPQVAYQLIKRMIEAEALNKMSLEIQNVERLGQAS